MIRCWIFLHFLQNSLLDSLDLPGEVLYLPPEHLLICGNAHAALLSRWRDREARYRGDIIVEAMENVGLEFLPFVEGSALFAHRLGVIQRLGKWSLLIRDMTPERTPVAPGRGKRCSAFQGAP